MEVHRRVHRWEAEHYERRKTRICQPQQHVPPDPSKYMGSYPDLVEGAIAVMAISISIATWVTAIRIFTCPTVRLILSIRRPIILVCRGIRQRRKTLLEAETLVYQEEEAVAAAFMAVISSIPFLPIRSLDWWADRRIRGNNRQQTLTNIITSITTIRNTASHTQQFHLLLHRPCRRYHPWGWLLPNSFWLVHSMVATVCDP